MTAPVESTPDPHAFAPRAEPVQRINREQAERMGFRCITEAEHDAQRDLDAQIAAAGLQGLV